MNKIYNFYYHIKGQQFWKSAAHKVALFLLSVSLLSIKACSVPDEEKDMKPYDIPQSRSEQSVSEYDEGDFLEMRRYVSRVMKVFYSLENQLMEENEEPDFGQWPISNIMGYIDRDSIHIDILNVPELYLAFYCDLNPEFNKTYHLTDSLKLERQKMFYKTLLKVRETESRESLEKCFGRFYLDWREYVRENRDALDSSTRLRKIRAVRSIYKVTATNLRWGGGYEFDCPADWYILDAAEESGCDLPYVSRAGTDDGALGLLISGTVDQSHQSYLDDDEISAGYFLYDVAYPTSDIKMFYMVQPVGTIPPVVVNPEEPDYPWLPEPRPEPEPEPEPEEPEEGPVGGGDKKDDPKYYIKLSCSNIFCEMMDNYTVTARAFTQVAGQGDKEITESIAKTEFFMRRIGSAPTGWLALDYGQDYNKYKRVVTASGYFQYKAKVHLKNGVIVESGGDDFVVAEIFPTFWEFWDRDNIQRKAIELWEKSVDFARNNQSNYMVQEYGCLIYLNTATGEYYCGETIEGVPVSLTSGPVVEAGVGFEYNLGYYDPRTTASYVVGTIHSHYPLEWAPPRAERQAGPSTTDWNAELPGIVWDYQHTVYSGDKSDNPKNPHTMWFHYRYDDNRETLK